MLLLIWALNTNRVYLEALLVAGFMIGGTNFYWRHISFLGFSSSIHRKTNSRSITDKTNSNSMYTSCNHHSNRRFHFTKYNLSGCIVFRSDYGTHGI